MFEKNRRRTRKGRRGQQRSNHVICRISGSCYVGLDWDFSVKYINFFQFKFLLFQNHKRFEKQRKTIYFFDTFEDQYVNAFLMFQVRIVFQFRCFDYNFVQLFKLFPIRTLNSFCHILKDKYINIYICIILINNINYPYVTFLLFFYFFFCNINFKNYIMLNIFAPQNFLFIIYV